MKYKFNKEQYEYSREANPIEIWVSDVDESEETALFNNYPADVSLFILKYGLEDMICYFRKNHNYRHFLVKLVDNELNIVFQKSLNIEFFKDTYIEHIDEHVASMIINEYYKFIRKLAKRK